MEKIENKVCKVYIDNSYKNFNNVMRESSKVINFDNLNSEYDLVLIITDENVYKHQLDEFSKSLKSKIVYEYIVAEGEDSKTIETYEEIMKYLVRINLSRKSLIIALGGGVVGDLAGFVASTYMRGIDIVQVPTTLLSQVDSSVGGKTGINLGKLKNIIGSFYHPKVVYININSLKTLNQDEFESGMAEVIKYAFIYDYEFLNYLIENSEDILNKDEEKLKYIVKKCISIKAKVVEMDEFEGGLRKILNFGHTFGHGVEKLCNLSHGYAVSVGMHMAFKLALKENLIQKDYYDKFIEVCKKYYLPIDFENANENEILETMKSDKKNSFSKINLVLPVKEGKVEVIDSISDEKIIEVIKECKYA